MRGRLSSTEFYPSSFIGFADSLIKLDAFAPDQPGGRWIKSYLVRNMYQPFSKVDRKLCVGLWVALALSALYSATDIPWQRIGGRLPPFIQI